MSGPSCLQHAYSYGESQAPGLIIELGALVTPGSLLLAQVGIDKDAGSTPQPSSGWTLLQGDNSTSVSTAMAWRISDGTTTDICTWSWTTPQWALGSMVEYADATIYSSAITATNESSVSSILLSTSTPEGNWIAVAATAVDTYDGNLSSSVPTWTNGFVPINDTNEALTRDIGNSGGGQIAELIGDGEGTISTTWTNIGSDQTSGIIVVLSLGERTHPPIVWAVGDGASNKPTCHMVARRMSAVDHFLYLGDVYDAFAIAYDPIYGETALHDYRSVTSPTEGNVDHPFNRDVGEYDDYFATYLGARSLPTTFPGNSRYSFTVNGWTIIVINTEEIGGVDNGDGGIGSTAMTWLDSELDTAAGKAIVVGHRPRWSPGEDVIEDRGDQPDLDDMWNLIEGRAVAYLTGHSHIMAQMPPIGGTTQLIAGSGGDSNIEVTDNSAAGSPIFVDSAETYGALRMTFESDEIIGQFIRGTDGVQLHSFTLEAPGPEPEPNPNKGSNILMLGVE